MRIIMLFLDGVGLGEDDPGRNPLVGAHMPNLRGVLDGRPLRRETGPFVTAQATLIPTDATLGVEGLPQSATGQTALLTGVNAARAIGCHWGPWPDQALREIIRRESVFKKTVEAGGRACLANAYPQRYFDDLAARKRRLSAVPLAVEAAGLPLLRYEDLRAGHALSAEFTNDGWREHLGYSDLPVLGLEEAGVRLVQIARAYEFTFFEYWWTDLVAHRGTPAEAVEALERFDGFLGGVLSAFDAADTLLVLTSDHGNLEDMSSRRHTLNPVPTLLMGQARDRVAWQIRALDDIAPAVLGVLEAER